jgi:DNA-binding NarL/FixJ family response regulator
VTSLLVVDAPHDRVEAWRVALEAAGYRVVQSAIDDGTELRIPAAPPDVIVLGAPSPDCRAWDFLELLRTTESALAAVPVVVIVGVGAWEDGLRGGIEGAVRCLAEPVEAERIVATLDAVLACDAPPVAEQRRRTRQRALEMLAAFESRGAASDADVHPRFVHLTRLEHGPVRSVEPDPLADVRRRVSMLTTKQRGLLHLIEAEGGVTAAAARLGTSRGNVYAGLRRVVHRLGVRDTAELLRLIDSGELLQTVPS